MRARHTRLSDRELSGGTTQRSYRIPTVLLERVESELAIGVPEIYNVTDAICDSLWLWLYEVNRMRHGQREVPVAVTERLEETRASGLTIPGTAPPEGVDVAEDGTMDVDEQLEMPYTTISRTKPDFSEITLPPRGT